MHSKMLVSELFKPNEKFLHQLTNYSNNQYHAHEFIEIFYVISGSAQQKLNNKTNTISIGDLFLLRPSDHHSFSSKDPNFIHRDFLIEPNMFQQISSFFSEDFYKSIMNSTLPINLNISQNRLNDLENSFNHTNTINNDEVKNVSYSFILSEILALIFNTNLTSSFDSPTIWINELISQLNSPYNLATPIEDILSQFSYSRPYICRVFKQYTGMSPIKYFNDLKLSQAYLLIKSSATSITKIAESVGFYHRSFFYKIFKEKYGITPSEAKKGIPPVNNL